VRFIDCCRDSGSLQTSFRTQFLAPPQYKVWRVTLTALFISTTTSPDFRAFPSQEVDFKNISVRRVTNKRSDLTNSHEESQQITTVHNSFFQLM